MIQMEKKRRGVIHQKRAVQQKATALKNQKEEVELDNWSEVKKHPITKVVLVVGVTFGLLYVSSYLFDAAAKSVESFGRLQQALKR